VHAVIKSSKHLGYIYFQYLIVNSSINTQTEGTQPRADLVVADAWRFMRDKWKLQDPKMIISVTGGARKFYMKQRLLDSFKRGLMRAATATGTFLITASLARRVRLIHPTVIDTDWFFLYSFLIFDASDIC
jgi:hypothetical protein